MGKRARGHEKDKEDGGREKLNYKTIKNCKESDHVPYDDIIAHINGCSPAEEGRCRGGYLVSHGHSRETTSAGERSVEQRPHDGALRLLEKVRDFSTQSVTILFQKASCLIGNLEGRGMH